MKIIKRDGNQVDFNKEKIVNAIIKAMNECEVGVDEELAWDIAEDIEDEFEDNDTLPTVESVQDRVEELLAENGRFDASRRYILYRQERTKLRNKGWEMTDLQRDIYEKKYRFEKESFDEFLDRVSGGNSEIKKLIRDKKFLPAGRILAGRGLNERGKKVTLSNCFVLPQPEDNIESIFDIAKQMARTYSWGGGVGIDISKLRPSGAKVNNAAKNTSGSVSFMDLYSMTTELIGQSGRRGALMISLDCKHPDLLSFLAVKSDLNKVTKANISVKITDDFMKAVENDDEWDMAFYIKDTNEVITKQESAKKIFRLISEYNHEYSEPGAIFWSRISDWNLLSEDDEFEYVGLNPCLTGDMRLLTENGFETFAELEDKKVSVVNINGEITEGKVWCSGEKNTIKLVLSNKKEITCTPNHIFMTIDESECEAKKLKNKKIMPYTGNHKMFNDEYVKYGFIQGDGCLGRLESDIHKGLEVNIGEKDDDVFFLFRNDEFTKGDRKIYLQGDYKDKLINLGFDSNPLPERKFPTTYDGWTNLQKASFLQGCYSANGSIITNYRISYKTTSKDFAEKLIETLAEDFGITAYITTNKAKEVKFSNGRYLCKESYDINIGKYEDIQTFHNEINFYHLYKKIALRNLLLHKAPYVMNIKENGIKKVYDFTEPKTHWGVVEGYIAHNCAEEPLPEYGSCNLSSINLSEFVINPFTKNARFDFEGFKNTVKQATIYMNEILDEAINNNLYPLKEQKQSVIDWRQIGIGIMGWCDALIKLKLEYGSEESLELADKIGFDMINSALQQSALLAKDSGTYPKYKEDAILSSSFFKYNACPETVEMVKKYGLKNSQLLTTAPTGSISTMWGISGGLEPIFNLSYTRKTESLHGTDMYYKVFTPIVKSYMETHNIANEEDLPKFFVTAMTLNYKDRIKMQSVWQKHIDASISSTVNVPNEFTIEEVEDLYYLAWKMGLKGVTIFRDGSARSGILLNDKGKEQNKQDKISKLQQQIDKLIEESLTENPNECPMCGGEMIHSGGCSECRDCSYSPCSI